MKMITRINTNEELYSDAHSKPSFRSLARSRKHSWSGFWSINTFINSRSSFIMLHWSQSRFK